MPQSWQDEYIVAYNAVSSLTRGAAPAAQISLYASILASFKMLVDSVQAGRGSAAEPNPFDLR